MHDSAPQHQRADIRAEKVKRLTQLIADCVAKNHSEAEKTPLHCALIAKSPKSAAVAALECARDMTGGDGIVARVLFVGGHDQISWPAASPRDEVRRLHHHGLQEAHERLIIGSTTVWTGDSLRRAPDKVDGFESLEADDVAAWLWASKSFDKLWERATRVKFDPVAGIEPQLPAAQCSPRSLLLKSIGSSES